MPPCITTYLSWSELDLTVKTSINGVAVGAGGSGSGDGRNWNYNWGCGSTSTGRWVYGSDSGTSRNDVRNHISLSDLAP
ncbi:hypothetical protein MKX01_037976 [Papaver californicum]|nr:hypothetical protein MKX01_037976 [Papaver californicum]